MLKDLEKFCSPVSLVCVLAHFSCSSLVLGVSSFIIHVPCSSTLRSLTFNIYYYIYYHIYYLARCIPRFFIMNFIRSVFQSFVGLGPQQHPPPTPKIKRVKANTAHSRAFKRARRQRHYVDPPMPENQSTNQEPSEHEASNHRDNEDIETSSLPSLSHPPSPSPRASPPP